MGRDSNPKSRHFAQRGEPPHASGSKIQNPKLPPSADSTIRVDVELLDMVMNLVGELVLVRNQIVHANSVSDSASATSQRLNSITTALQAGVMKTRMQPISTIWQKFGRVIRDLAIACEKQVQVEMVGTETELDRSIIEAIKDPLTHIVRNCIDHGIEYPAVRTECGKPADGRLLLRAAHESGKVNIEISDDGAGIDPETIKQKAQQLGLISSAQAASMSESEAINLIFLPGFSTAAQITNLSGRGVGMNVVKANIEKINGTVEVFSKLGQGTKFKLKIPLTLAIIPALIVKSGGDRYAIPQTSLQELIRLEGQAIHEIETLYDVPVYRLRGNLLPLVNLNQELQLQDTLIDTEALNIVVIHADEYRFGLVVDQIEDTQDIVVKPLGKQLKQISTFAGATILGDGKVALIIDAVGLANHAGVTDQMQQRLTNTQATQVQAAEAQMVLLFQGPHGARMGIPMSLASRLEEFPYSMVEQVGNQYVVQYRNQILPLIDLHCIFAPNSSQPLANSRLIAKKTSALDPKMGNGGSVDDIQVVVVSLGREHSVGLVVERILDIVAEPLNIKGTASRAGVLYLAVIQGQITEILDIERVIQLDNPHFQLSVCGANSK